LKKFDWYGEFGWEVMTFAPYARKECEGQKCLVESFEGMSALYKDFADFGSHGETKRHLQFPKRYKYKGKYFKYGNPNHKKDILVHARGCSKKSAINYKNWEKIKVDAGYIGTNEDKCFGEDLRNIELQELMDIIAGAKVVVGCSSGVIHLAMACGTPVIVWGDNRTYFGETLEKRYKETWNPFKVDVKWINSNDWQPEPEEIVNACRSFMQHIH
jgi:hypothetical protein